MTYYSDSIGLPPSDKTRWRLRTDDLGRETWHYLSETESLAEPQTNTTKYLLDMADFKGPPAEKKITTAMESAMKGAEFLSHIQEECGIFACQYKGPMFMTVGYVFASYFTKTPIPDVKKHEMIRYIVNTAHPVDGGWGLHSVDKSTCFGTTINYVVLRLLGLPKDHMVCVKAQKTLFKLGGALGNPHWGKAWLSLLNLYGWEGVNPAPPEMWLLPYSLSIHPARWWVHTRAIYLPLAYLSANRSTCQVDPLLEQIRSEIYLPRQLPYASIDFSAHRNTVCGVDLYYPHTKILDTLNWCIAKYEKYVRPKWLLKQTNKTVYDLIQKECQNTEYLCIAPVSFAFNMIVTYLEEGADSKAFQCFLEKKDDVVFHGPQGLTVMGTNGVQVWDVAFMCQYLIMAGLLGHPQYHDMILKGYWFLRRSQFTDECVEGSYRDKRKGAWPFSTKTQGYTVSDCTAEAMKAIIMVENDDYLGHQIEHKIERQSLEDAVDRILFIQNTDSFEYGSFSAYEKIRASPMMEWLSPAEVFNQIMVEYPYVECTDSSVFGLLYFSKYYPDYKPDVILHSIDIAIAYIENAQDKQDGSWYGSWGVCYTYAAMFAVEALESVGKVYGNSEVVKKGLDFLVAKQETDGGWSESMKACETHTYVPNGQSMVVQTAWAVIALILGEFPERGPIDKGIQLIMQRQSLEGEWKFEDVEGVFNHSCAIEYPTYKFLFPIKALGLYAARFGQHAAPLR
ncbi:terpene synthase [Metschnikowia bicuspidata var. bicuspidata NRRL YB-4993]|uniref:Terpene cyclase/mutase family member n=1 Tax=Metschnikowia bicuspidata var. bicuspidata NRRL YB-4993 TaxID=869754 RepID=A0A1A0HKD3_9ASCO|nr:terpene synthase [Metschnikowia bicuspidata var. bicuspidata NRRL YB-4993]OBA24347.1 terpene synthase [Metschnikowia bicuspidata var. bicuspidata NRRL YB-4993]